MDFTRSSSFPDELRDLPTIPVGSKPYVGQGARTPVADANNVILKVVLPNNVDPMDFLFAYSDRMEAQGWEAFAVPPPSFGLPAEIRLSRGMWTMYLVVAKVDGESVLSIQMARG